MHFVQDQKMTSRCLILKETMLCFQKQIVFLNVICEKYKQFQGIGYHEFNNTWFLKHLSGHSNIQLLT